MVEHAWVFVVVLLGGLALGLLPRRKGNKKEKESDASK